MPLGDLLFRGTTGLKRLLGNTTTTRKFLRQVGNGSTSDSPAWDQVKDSDLSTSDITTNDVSTAKHGFTPKAPNDTAKFLRGDATWATPPGSASALEDLSDVALSSPLSDGEVLTYDNGSGLWTNAAPVGGSGGSPSLTLDGLSDVSITSPVDDGDVLTYDTFSGLWVNAAPTGGSPGGGAGWVLIDSWTHSGDVANVDFTNLSGYSAIMVIVRNVTLSASGLPFITVSDDNGGTFYTTSGHYVSISDAGVATNQGGFVFYGTSTTAARTGMMMITGFNQDGFPKPGIGRQSVQHLFVQSTGALNAIRVANSGGDFTGGSIYVLGM